MKKLYILMIAMFLVYSACQKSQFSTTTRQTRNGKVSYVNHYRNERIKTLKGKHPKNLIAQNNSPATDRTGVGNLQEPGITRLNPDPVSEIKNLVASTSDEPAILAAAKILIVPARTLRFTTKNNHESVRKISFPETREDTAINEGTTGIRVAKIKFKNGHEEVVKIIYQSRDTIKYHYLRESDAIRTVTMDKVDSILPDPRKTEKLGIIGFIFSILGLVPVFGLFFSVLAIIFGARSLRRIHKFPERFKGKGFSIAATVIGLVATIVNFILIIVILSTAFHSCSHSYTRW